MMYHKKKYGDPFSSSQVNKEKNRKEYLLCDHDNDDEFVTERELGCENKFDKQDLPPHYIGSLLEKICIKRNIDQDQVMLNNFKTSGLSSKYGILKTIRKN